MSQATTPRRDNKTAIVGVPMTETMRATVEDLAAERKWSKAQAARHLIERGIEAELADAAKASAA